MTRWIIVLGLMMALIQGSHLYLLGKTRDQARAALEHTLQDVETSGTERIGAALTAFDRMTADIFFAATGPYLILALLVPCVLVSLMRLQKNLAATESALKTLLNNRHANNGMLSRS